MLSAPLPLWGVLRLTDLDTLEKRQDDIVDWQAKLIAPPQSLRQVQKPLNWREYDFPLSMARQIARSLPIPSGVIARAKLWDFVISVIQWVILAYLMTRCL